MTAPTLEGTEIAADSPEFKLYQYTVTARPKYAKPFTFYVLVRGKQFHVTAGPTSGSYFSKHRSLFAAVKSANYRARRYNRAYSRPRNVLPTQAVTA